MTTSLILAIDQGTTNTKALLVGADGLPRFHAATPMGVQSPHPGWVEQDAMKLWESVLEVVQRCQAWAAEQGCMIAGVAVSNQRETVVAWRRSTGQPIAPAVVWQCRRSAAICETLRAAGREAMVRERTGLGLDPLYSAGKMRWLLDNVSGARELAAAGDLCLGTVDSWLTWKLSDGSAHVCDVSNASRTQLFHLHRLVWDEELLGLFDVPRGALPEVLPSAALRGHARGVPGLRGVPIVASIGDSHAALAGHGCMAAGTVKATYGTGSSLMTLLPGNQPASSQRLATTVAWGTDGGVTYALEGNVSMTGAAVQWVGEFLGLPDPVADTVRLAESVADSSGVSFVPAMVGLGAPYWDTAAKGIVAGLRHGSRAAHLARAAVEAIALQVRDVFAAMVEEAGVPLLELRADGGATRNEWLMQWQADVLGCPVLRSEHEELSALGAARLGGVALGWWSGAEELGRLPTPHTPFAPRMKAAEREARVAEWLLAVRRARLQEANT